MYSCGIQQIEPILGSFVHTSFQVLMVRIDSPLIHESRVLMVITNDIVVLEFRALMGKIAQCFLRYFIVGKFR